jgi:hypothetical protein
MEIQDVSRELTIWKRKCSELETSQHELHAQYESMLPNKVDKRLREFISNLIQLV